MRDSSESCFVCAVVSPRSYRMMEPSGDVTFSSVARELVTRGIAVLPEPPLSSDTERELRDSLDAFLTRPLEYRDAFSHARFARESIYDGYSYFGQRATDCVNQYPTDMLHSFVLSDCADDPSTPCGCSHDFPVEFESVTSHATWRDAILHRIEALEEGVCAALDRALGLDGSSTGSFSELLARHCCHMLSCNMYPPTHEINSVPQAVVDDSKSCLSSSDPQPSPPPRRLRLSEHVDVSLLTVFPFGLGAGFSFVDPQTREVTTLAAPIRAPVVFAGHLAEVISSGRVRALRHCVALPCDVPGGGVDDDARYSFACFSIPRLGHQIRVPADATILMSRLECNDAVSAEACSHPFAFDLPHAAGTLSFCLSKAMVRAQDGDELTFPSRDDSSDKDWKVVLSDDYYAAHNAQF